MVLKCRGHLVKYSRTTVCAAAEESVIQNEVIQDEKSPVPGGLCRHQGGQGGLQRRTCVTTGSARPGFRQRRQQGAWCHCQQIRKILHHTEWETVSVKNEHLMDSANTIEPLIPKDRPENEIFVTLFYFHTLIHNYYISDVPHPFLSCFLDLLSLTVYSGSLCCPSLPIFWISLLSFLKLPAFWISAVLPHMHSGSLLPFLRCIQDLSAVLASLAAFWICLLAFLTCILDFWCPSLAAFWISQLFFLSGISVLFQVCDSADVRHHILCGRWGEHGNWPPGCVHVEARQGKAETAEGTEHSQTGTVWRNLRTGVTDNT